MRRPCWKWLALTAILVAAEATPALAHKLSVFAVAEGKTIRGRAFLHGGGEVGRATVTILGPQGETLGETTTDAQGKFQWEARFRSDHRLVVDSGDGHRAEYTILAAVLPASLPARGEGPSPASDKPAGPASGSPASPASGSVPPAEDPQLAAQVQTLVQQIGQLQMQLAEASQKNRLQDILGGIGYILGLMGLTFYFLGVRRKTTSDHAN